PADAADALALAICHLWRPAGALGSPQREPGALTPAQRTWAAAEQAARRR
ncbi:MAG: crossover junction endodeoxyribonuclease RuvC, partial [Micrococcales bacterium]|nr:crossover junction endodeoxyribonuclease RuvC [Micrococcales bacterium]